MKTGHIGIDLVKARSTRHAPRWRCKLNQTDRERLARLYTCVAMMPFPSPMSTLGVGDLSRFHDHMKDLRPQIGYAIMAISRCDVPEEDPERELEGLERMLARMEVE